MRPSELIERYIAIVERENDLRASQLRLLSDSQQAAQDARRFIEMMISREMVAPRSASRRNPLARPVPPPPRPPQMEVHGVTIDIPASAVGNELSLLQHLFGFLEESSSREALPGLTDAEIDQACISREWDETTDAEQLPTCPITLARFSQGDRVKKIRRCGHEFSAGAITQALRTSPLCPLCRANVTHS